MATTTATANRRVALGIFGLLSVADIALLALTDGQNPPYAVAGVVAVLGLVSLVLVVRALRDANSSLRLLVVLRVLSALTAVPAFLAPDVPVQAQVAGAAVIVLTTVGVLLSGRRSTVSVA